MALPWPMMGREIKRVLLEALVVAGIGIALAVLANLVSPRGLSLTRDYFPLSKTAHGENGGTNPSVNTAGSATNRPNQSDREIVEARLKEKGLKSVDGGEALQLFRDPQHE